MCIQCCVEYFQKTYFDYSVLSVKVFQIQIQNTLFQEVFQIKIQTA